MNSSLTPRIKNSRIWWVALTLLLLLLASGLSMGQKLGLAMGPLVSALQKPVAWADQFSLWFDESEQLQQRYTDLQATYKEQQALLQQLSAIKSENEKLRQLLMITTTDDFHWHAARVVSRGQEVKSRRLMLKISGVHPDDVVVSHEGLVGIIDESNNSYAVVRTILDASLAVPVTMEGSALAALVRGDGEQLLVDFVPLIMAPKVGDILVTSGAGGLFPSGLPVAKVDEVREVSGGIFAEVLASPVAHWKRDAWLAIAERHGP